VPDIHEAVFGDGVQTTLLGLAIAIILALATALAAPLFIDWSRYRGEFEARASSLTGLDIRITGAIDARLLPTPTLVMQGIEIVRPDDLGKDINKLRARALRLEFELGALARGEWRLRDVGLEGPQLSAGIDAAGHLDWSAPKAEFKPGGVSIERLHVKDGRATFVDAATGSRLVLDNLEFRGELRSLSGPIKGDGSFVVGGEHFPYRIAASRIDGGTAAKLRLSVDAIDRPLAAEADISISLDHGIPRFEGNLQFTQPVGRAPAGSQSPIVEPWRLTGHVKGDSAAAMLEQIEFQYGPDERATKLRGTADLRFGRNPRADVVLTSPQIDLDRMPALADAAHPRPLTAAKLLAEALSRKLPMPASLSVAVESVGLGGATLQRLHAELESDGERFDIKTLEFRAPGVTQVRLSRNRQTTPSGAQFAGHTTVETNDARALVAWLVGRSDGSAAAAGALRLAGDVTLSQDAISVERIELDLDRMSMTGRFAYAWGGDHHPARLDAALSAPDIDLDRVQDIATAMLGDTAAAWPRAGHLSLKVGRALILGVEARQADVNVRIDANGIDIDPLTIADFGGAALAVRGRIDTRTASPRGTVTLDLDARALDGVLAVMEKFAPETAEQLRRSAPRVAPVLLRASLTMDPGAATNAPASAKLKVDGRAGTFRLAVLGDALGAPDALRADKLAALRAAKLNLIGRLETDDGPALVELTRLDRYISVDKGAARAALTMKGTLGDEIEVEGSLTAGSLAVSTNGKVYILPWASPRAALELRLGNANIRLLRPMAGGGRAAELLPVSLTTRLALAQGTVRLADIKGIVAGAAVGGRLAVGIASPMTIDGELDLSALDLPHVVAVAIGAPADPPAASIDARTLWPTEPFEQLLVPLSGQVAVKSKRVALVPKLEGRNFNGVVRFGQSQVALEVRQATVAGGELAGELIFLRERAGVVARTRFNLVGANAAELLPGDGAVSGRLGAQVSAQGTGMSAVALIGSLEGSGNFTLENGRLARLDPTAFEAVMHAVDQGLPIDASRLRERTDSALANGALAIPRAEGAISIAAGQARVSNSVAGEPGSELAASGRVDLTNGDLDARLVLARAPASGAIANSPPEIVIALKGPMGAPKRSIDVATFANWLALRAVDQQAKKLDVLEGRETSVPGSVDAGAPAEEPARLAQPPKPRTAPSPVPPPSRPRPTARVQKPSPELVQPVQPTLPFFWFGAH
jgi:uncharacterized protein involved in outer membrane biogenesis